MMFPYGTHLKHPLYVTHSEQSDHLTGMAVADVLIMNTEACYSSPGMRISNQCHSKHWVQFFMTKTCLVFHYVLNIKQSCGMQCRASQYVNAHTLALCEIRQGY